MIEQTSASDTFEGYRPLLFSIAYRMVGSAAESEDLVQETFLRWHGATSDDDAEPVRTPKSWLTTAVTRLAIDHLKSARVRREQYVGPWLPEPLETAGGDDPADGVELAESLSIAFLVLLERLTPVERAVFLLHDVFGYGYLEIASIVGKSEANCRQVARRARAAVVAHRPRFHTDADQGKRLLDQFIRTSTEGDMPGLVALLAQDVIVWADGGGKAFAARKPVIGADKVARFFLNIVANVPAEDVHVRRTSINGHPALVLSQEGEVVGAWVLDVADDRIRTIWTIVNPDKLARLRP